METGCYLAVLVFLLEGLVVQRDRESHHHYLEVKLRLWQQREKLETQSPTLVTGMETGSRHYLAVLVFLQEELKVQKDRVSHHHYLEMKLQLRQQRERLESVEVLQC